jgi:small subunit ribosomal protein S15
MFLKKAVIEKYKLNVNDTGSNDVQVALITARIDDLSIHLKKFPNDFSSKTNFLKLISQRKKILKYIKRKNDEKYFSLIKKLNLRK